MTQKSYKGKALYHPKGKALEYSEWACNFYVGCSNECTYCYLKKGIGKKTLGGNIPTLKKCFKDEEDALRVFKKELLVNLEDVQKHGIFFSFTTDPMLNETKMLTADAIDICQEHKVPVKILTKRADFFTFLSLWDAGEWDRDLIAFGFTLTGADHLEPHASKNKERIEAMKKCKVLGYRTFASIEPIIDFSWSWLMIDASAPYCDLFKVGLESGGKYDIKEARNFVSLLMTLSNKIYMKDSLCKLTGYQNNTFKGTGLGENFVERDYNLFTDK